MSSSFPNDFESEDSFHNYSEHDLNEGEKASILAAMTQLRPILNWEPREDEDMFDKQRGEDIVTEALSHYMSWKEFIFESAGSDSQRLQRVILYNIAKLCFYYWLRDSRLVSEILREAYMCDNYFFSLFPDIFNQYDMRLMWQSGFHYSRQTVALTTIYFIHHAYKARLKFHETRFVDMPLFQNLRITPAYLAAILIKPQLLLYLFRHGAKMEIDHLNGLPDTYDRPRLLCQMINILWNELCDDLQQIDSGSYNRIVMNNNVHDVTECLRILLRVIPQIRMNEIHFHLLKFRDRGVLSVPLCSHEFIHLLCKRGLVPRFDNRYFEPSDLYHLCRCAIRSRLNSSWNLPYGIHALPLPRRVKRYLYLDED